MRGLELLLRRLMQALVLALGVGMLCLLMMRALPGDMALRVAAGRYGFDRVDNAAADAVRAELGLDRSLWQVLPGWWLDLLSLDLGRSLVTGAPVLEELAHQLGATLQLSGAALALALPIGLLLGLRAGLRPGGTVDRLTLALAVLLRVMPSFLLAVLLMLGVAVGTGALPVAGDQGPASLLLPAATLAAGLAAGLARITRQALRGFLASDAWAFARMKGLSESQALRHHGLRHVVLPVLAWLGVQAVFLVEGAVVVESLFAWPGIGHALVHAVFARDVPMIQGTALCMGLMFVLFNLLTDAASVAADPRRRAPQAGEGA